MLEHVKLWGVKDPNISSQLILAKKMGYFEKEGLNVSYRLLPSGTIMPREILRAPIKPLAWTQTVITTLILREQKLDVKIIAPLADISSTQQVIIRKKQSHQFSQRSAREKNRNGRRRSDLCCSAKYGQRLSHRSGQDRICEFAPSATTSGL